MNNIINNKSIIAYDLIHNCTNHNDLTPYQQLLSGQSPHESFNVTDKVKELFNEIRKDSTLNSTLIQEISVVSESITVAMKQKYFNETKYSNPSNGYVSKMEVSAVMPGVRNDLGIQKPEYNPTYGMSSSKSMGSYNVSR